MLPNSNIHGHAKLVYHLNVLLWPYLDVKWTCRIGVRFGRPNLTVVGRPLTFGIGLTSERLPDCSGRPWTCRIDLRSERLPLTVVECPWTSMDGQNWFKIWTFDVHGRAEYVQDMTSNSNQIWTSIDMVSSRNPKSLGGAAVIPIPITWPSSTC